MPNSQSNESTVTFPLKVLTSANLQFLLNYIAQDLGLVNAGSYRNSINGKQVHKDLEFISDGTYTTYGELPIINTYKYPYIYRAPGVINSAIVFNDEIHIFGTGYGNSYSLYGDTKRSHFIGNFKEWRREFNCPEDLYNARSVIYNNKVHILYQKKHYTFSGDKWKRLGDLPKPFSNSIAVVYNGKIHILSGNSGSDTRTMHYSWNGNEWISESTLPYDMSCGKALVYNNKIHIFGGYASAADKAHYSWDGNNWVSESTLPQATNNYTNSFYVVLYKNKIHLFWNVKHYVYENNEWVLYNDLPYYIDKGTCLIYNNKIILMGGSDSGTYNYITYPPHFNIYYNDNNDTWSQFEFTESKYKLV